MGLLGAIAASSGIEHGVGEIAQGNVAPAAISFASWPDSEAFRILAGEPAMSIVPNLLVTGILAITCSVTFLVWAVLFVERRRAGIVLIALAIVLLLVGGGFGPPLVGVLVGTLATRINTPLRWWRDSFPAGLAASLASLWTWFLGVDLVAWLSLSPGLVLLAAITGTDAIPPETVYVLTACAFGFLFLAGVAALARDARGSAGLPAPPR